MRRKSGFTITELLAVIVIMGILMIIATVSYNGISNKVKTATLNQKVNYYKEKVLEYAEDNDITTKTISLSSLIELGYVDAEHPENPTREKIDNPVTNGFLDCMNFTITRDLTDYEVTYDLDGSCELLAEEEKEQEVTIERYVKEDDRFVKIGYEWVNEPVYLLVKVANMNRYTLNNNKIDFNIGGSISSGNGNIYCDDINNNSDPENNCLNVKKVSTNYIYNNKVYATLELLENQNVGSTVVTKNYKISKDTTVKIDNEKPVLNVDYSNSYTKDDVTVALSGSDGNGSGIYGYYFSEDPNLPSDYTRNNFVSPKEITVSKNGKYYAYTVDNTGNVSERQEINISTIDKTGPENYISYNNRYNWSQDDLTVTFGCKGDTKVGCAEEVTYSIYDTSSKKGRKAIVENKTVNSKITSYTFHLDNIDVAARGAGDDERTGTTEAEKEAIRQKWALENEKVNNNYISTAEIVYTIKDNIGNTVTYHENINVMIDKVTPIMTLAAGDRQRKSKWWGLVTTGYEYRVYMTINNKDAIPSGIDSKRTAFSLSIDDVDKLKSKPVSYWDSYFADSSLQGEEVKIVVPKNGEKKFSFRAVSKVGVASYGKSVLSEGGCKEYLAAAAAGGASGLMVGGFALLLFGGPVGWVLAGAAAAGVVGGAALCATN